MSVIEFTRPTLGHWKEDIWGDREWTSGCGPSGEIGVYVYRAYNVSDKKIESVEFCCAPFDAAGNKVGEEMKCVYGDPDDPGDGWYRELTEEEKSGEEEVIGDYESTEGKIWERLWCAPTAQYVEITNAHIIYADGSKEDIDGKNITYLGDEDSIYEEVLEAKKLAFEKACEEASKAYEEKWKTEKEAKKAEEERRRAVEEARRAEEEKERKAREEKAAREFEKEAKKEKMKIIIGCAIYLIPIIVIIILAGWVSSCVG